MIGRAKPFRVNPMKIATFNINNINKRLANLLVWLRRAQRDVVRPQELKAADREFPQKAIAEAGVSSRVARAELLERRLHAHHGAYSAPSGQSFSNTSRPAE